MAKMFPPRGYTAEQYPLPHNFSSGFGLGLTAPTKNSTIVPIIRATELAAGVEAVEVNPRHNSFGEDTGMSCFMGSIIPRINFSFQAFIPEAAIATGVKYLVFNWMPIYISFKDWDVNDQKTDVGIHDILELSANATTYSIEPAYATKLFNPSSMPLSTKTDADESIVEWGLTTDATYEAIPFDKELFYDALQYYTNKEMLKKVVGPMHSVVLKEDRPFRFSSNNFTQPSVKRMNQYTFCGILFHLDQADTATQPVIDADITDISHLQINYRCRYNEWNPNFDQTPF